MKLLLILFIFPHLILAKDLNSSAFLTLMQKKNVLILDVRTPIEFSRGHIKKSKNLNAYSFNLSNEILKIDKNKKVLIYCHSGVRSKNIYNKMKKMGFANVYNLLGGIVAWQKSGLKVIK